MKEKLKCVLLVDDNESDKFLHERVLMKSGITERVAVALNGKEALEMLSTKGIYGRGENEYFQPELIFLDINMPVMDGWEFLEEYQKLDLASKGNVIIIMLTTSINPADKIKAERFVQGHCFQYKPLTLKMIGELMERYFPSNK